MLPHTKNKNFLILLDTSKDKRSGDRITLVLIVEFSDIK